MKAAIICFVVFAMILSILGGVFYFAQKVISRNMRRVISVILPMACSLFLSYLIADAMVYIGFGGAVAHMFVFCAIWIFYSFIMRETFRAIKFLKKDDRESYGPVAYYKWRKELRVREKALSSYCYEDTIRSLETIIGEIIVAVTILAFCISLVIIYTNGGNSQPIQAISNEFIKAEFPVEVQNMQVPKGADIYTGLPANESNHFLKVEQDISLLGDKIEVYYVTSKSNGARYWLIYPDRLSEEQKTVLPACALDRKWLIIKDQEIAIYKDGALIN